MHHVVMLALQNIPQVLLALNLVVGPYSSLKSTRESTNSLELVELNYLPFFLSRFWINCGLDTQARWDGMRYLIYCRSCHTGAGARGRTKYSFLQSFPWIYHTVQEDLLESCSHLLLVQVWGPWTALGVEQWIMILLGGLVESLEMTLPEDLRGRPAYSVSGNPMGWQLRPAVIPWSLKPNWFQSFCLSTISLYLLPLCPCPWNSGMG